MSRRQRPHPAPMESVVAYVQGMQTAVLILKNNMNQNPWTDEQVKLKF